MCMLEPHTTKTVENGSPYPLGATLVDGGVNFAIYSGMIGTFAVHVPARAGVD